MVWPNSRTISCDHHGGAGGQHCPSRAGGQDGDVAVALLVDLDGALLLQLVNLLLQVALSLDGLVLLLEHLPQREHLRAGVLADLLQVGSGGKVKEIRCLSLSAVALEDGLRH